MKKLLAALLAVLMLCGGLGVGASAAVTQAADFTVTYDGNGAGVTGVPEAQGKIAGEALTLRNEAPTRPGYTFAGWAITPTGAVEYAKGATYTANANVILYAVWTPNTYIVTYKGNAIAVGNVPARQTKTHDVALTLSAEEPIRAGYTFKGWATSSDGAKAYDKGGSYTANADATLYAIWEKGSNPFSTWWKEHNPLNYLWWLLRSFLWALCFGWIWMPESWRP